MAQDIEISAANSNRNDGGKGSSMADSRDFRNGRASTEAVSCALLRPQVDPGSTWCVLGASARQHGVSQNRKAGVLLAVRDFMAAKRPETWSGVPETVPRFPKQGAFPGLLPECSSLTGTNAANPAGADLPCSCLKAGAKDGRTEAADVTVAPTENVVSRGAITPQRTPDLAQWKLVRRGSACGVFFEGVDDDE